MISFYDPFTILVVSLVSQWLAAYTGDIVARKAQSAEDARRGDFSTVLPAALTLLGLIVGFTFSMAVNRYDQRKNYEEAEANAIGTEYVRADLLPAADAARVRELLAQYVAQRVLFYTEREPDRLARIDAETAKLQASLWSAVASPALAQPTPVMALVVAGMNDLLNSQGYTQAAWWNRIPLGAWVLMGLVSLACNFLLGYGERHTVPAPLLVFPLLLTIPFFLIADIDSPRGGIIRVAPQNLIALSQTLQAH
jgi:hypothetical protein